MREFLFPSESQWSELCQRPLSNDTAVWTSVQNIVEEVKRSGDQALFRFTQEFDQISLAEFKLPLADGLEEVPDSVRQGIAVAAQNIRTFHKQQIPKEEDCETIPGVRCWRRAVPIERVGLYVPGGTAPLFSTLLMLAIPAQIAGCREIVVCTPPPVSPVIKYTASFLGISNLFQIGGAQAIAALAFGTESIPRVHKIFGPGNRYVTIAKQIVSQHAVVSIDLPAGPSELLLIADSSADPQFIVADLLSQAEHGIDSHVVLLTDSKKVIKTLRDELARQLEELPRREIAKRALAESTAIVFESLKECVRFSNLYAPEHLLMHVRAPEQLIDMIVNAGSVFVGEYTPESLGDYASGTNHTLPTGGFGASLSGVSLDSFLKKITFQQASTSGLRTLGPTVEVLARAEGLEGHARAVSKRLERINGY